MFFFFFRDNRVIWEKQRKTQAGAWLWMTEPPGCHLLYMFRGGLVLSWGIPFVGPPWLYSTLRLWNHRGESYELATTPGCLLFQQQESRGPPTPQKFIIRISPISDWVWQKSSRKIEIIPKLTKKKKVSFFYPPRPPWLILSGRWEFRAAWWSTAGPLASPHPV